MYLRQITECQEVPPVEAIILLEKLCQVKICAYVEVLSCGLCKTNRVDISLLHYTFQ